MEDATLSGPGGGCVTAPDVWIAKDDGSDVIRAAAITAVGRDYNGTITARLADGEGSAVTLVAVAPQPAKIFEITGLADRFRIFPDTKTATESN